MLAPAISRSSAPYKIQIPPPPPETTLDPTYSLDPACYRTPRSVSPYARATDSPRKILERSRDLLPELARDGGQDSYNLGVHVREPSDESGYTSNSIQDGYGSEKIKEGTFFSDHLDQKATIASPQRPKSNPRRPTVLPLAVEQHMTKGRLASHEIDTERTPHGATSIAQRRRKRRSSLPSLSEDHRPAPLNLTVLHPSNLFRSISDRSPRFVDLLQVEIPHFRIGSPRFTNRGTAYLQSIYTLGSLKTPDSGRSVSYGKGFDMVPAVPTGRIRDTSSPAAPLPQSVVEDKEPIKGLPSVDPSIYNSFVQDPDSPSYIIYTSTGQLLAATPARLVVQITHDQFLDYHLLSDFFLTYRSFMTPQNLLAFLFARLRWAVFGNEHGRIVRIRTFVALRHWILNYFLDDFAPNIGLRTDFCDFLNQLSADLRERGQNGNGDLQIIGELKKAWRRTCNIIWDMDANRPVFTSSQAIHPGGRALEKQAKPGFLSTLKAPTSRLQHSVVSRPLSAFGASSQIFALQNEAASPKASTYALDPIRHSSFTAASCSVPLWSRLLSAPKTLRPTLATGMEQTQSSRFMRKNRPGLRRGRPQSSKRTRHKHRHSALAASQLMDPCTRGDLIKGLVIPPVFAFARRISVQSSLAEDSSATASKCSASVTRRHSERGMRRPDSIVTCRALPVRKGRSRLPKRQSPHVSVDQLAIKAASSFANLLSTHDIPEQAEPIAEDPDRSRSIGTRIVRMHPALRRAQSRVTTGSRSIVIVDDTGARSTRCEGKRSFGEAHDTPHFPDLSYHKPTSVSTQDNRRSDFVKRGGHVRASSEIFRVGNHGFNPFEDDKDTKKLLEQSGGDHRNAEKVLGLDFRRRYSTSSIHVSSISQKVVIANPTMSNRLSGLLADDVTPMPETKQRNSLRLLSVDHSKHPVRASFQDQAARLASLDASGDGLDDGGVQSTLAKLEGTTVSSSASDSCSVSSGRKHLFSGLSTRSELKGLNLLIPEPSPPADETASFDFSHHPNHKSAIMSAEGMKDIDGPLSPESSQYGAMSEPLRTSFETVPESRAWPMSKTGLAPQNGIVSKSGSSPMILSKSPSSSFLLDPDQSLGIEDAIARKEERRIVLEQQSNGKKHESIAHSFLLEDDGSEYEEDLQTPVKAKFDDVAPLTPTIGHHSFRFLPPLSPPPSTPLPAPPINSFFTQLPTPEERGLINATETDAVETGLPSTTEHSHRAVSDQNEDTATLPAETKHARGVSDVSTERTLVDHSAHSIVQHTPFILAYSANTLAKHFTVIEQDALAGIDWQELIDMRWASTPVKVQDWALFLLEPDQGGVDLVIARFNLVVKWAVSEILLTSDVGQRAKTITKLIELAAACRKLGNYATLYQLTVAMLSPAVVKLRPTWAQVSPTACQTLAELELIVHPRGNFARLRNEMESRPGTFTSGPDARGAAPTLTHDPHRTSICGPNTGSGACIPFIGIYTHDLARNAQQKASGFAPIAPDGEAMVNFERYQSAARTVKGVLKLLESSSLYRIRPEAELVAKCLWLSALDDGEIARRSAALVAAC